MKILLLGSQHGNELLGRKLYDHILRRRRELLPYVTYKLANPRAFKAGVRYVHTDMNRSYASPVHESYEASRAALIMRYIDANGFDLVLDLHTTTCEQPPCLIVADTSPKNSAFIEASSIVNIVAMRHEIVKSSLIGVRPNVVCIEVNEHDTAAILESLCDDIASYVRNEKAATTHAVYVVESLLAKGELSEQDAAALVNFKRSTHGFYPILVGENSYKKQTRYLGFKAYERHAFKV